MPNGCVTLFCLSRTDNKWSSPRRVIVMGRLTCPSPPPVVAKDVSWINAELYFIATAILLCKTNDGWDTEETRRREG